VLRRRGSQLRDHLRRGHRDGSPRQPRPGLRQPLRRDVDERPWVRHPGLPTRIPTRFTTSSSPGRHTVLSPSRTPESGATRRPRITSGRTPSRSRRTTPSSTRTSQP
jgi:hypothetical protein